MSTRTTGTKGTTGTTGTTGPQARKRAQKVHAADPQWYKDAIIYEIHVRAFHDSNGDGIGDFPGLTEKLPYLADLGVTAIWLLPFYPSPLKDDGYDIADYLSIHPSYGTIKDFKAFLTEAHRLGLRVISELVINHTSDQHPWFQRARQAGKGSSARDFYVWSDDPERYGETRIIFKDFETSNWTWDPVAKAYYWHRFYSHQPDLNYDNPDVEKAVLKVLDFWFDLGIDGLRLDAIPYLYEREGTNCENLPETHAFLKRLRRHVDDHHEARMLLAEANQWPEDSVAYFGQGEGDECHMSFHFPIMPRMFMSIRMEDRFPLVDILGQTPAIPPTCQWALFLRNHDELTLEMVTDEERDYMYRVYAQDTRARINLGIRRRLAPLLGNHRRRIELMNGLLFSLPGTPVLYYGDEIGMGDNIYLGDRNGVRTPMQWSADRNAGFSRANPQQLYLPVIIDPQHRYEAVNVETQHANPHSLLWWTKRLIALRKGYKAFGRGTTEILFPDNRKVLAFVRHHPGPPEETILIVANLSRFVQGVELDLSKWRGHVPVELFGRTSLPRIPDSPYFITLGPHAFYWFALEPARPTEVRVKPAPGVGAGAAEPSLDLPALEVAGRWERVLARGTAARAALEAALPEHLAARRWFGGKARKIKGVSIRDVVPVGDDFRLVLLAVAYAEEETEVYTLPLAFAAGAQAEAVLRRNPRAGLARLTVAPEGNGDAAPAEGLLHDAVVDPRFGAALLDAIQRKRRIRGAAGEVVCSPFATLKAIARETESGLDGLEPTPMRSEQSNSSIVFGDRLVLKLFRRLEEGLNPDVEVGRFLTERAPFKNIPPVAGLVEYRAREAGTATVALLQGFVKNQGDAWRYTLDDLARFFERALARPPEARGAPPARTRVADLLEGEAPALAREMVGAYLESARLLGQRTAEMHVALASDTRDKDFAPEAFSSHYQRSIYQSMRSHASLVLPLLKRRFTELEGAARRDAEAVLAREAEIVARFRAVVDRKLDTARTRHHGDYHLGQVLHTGKDFVIIDFEGEPARPLGERRLKRSPLRDVAGMLRSFHYAAAAALSGRATGGIRPEDLAALAPWARAWYEWVASTFLRAYVEGVSAARVTPPLAPRARADLALLLDAFLLEKAVYEVGYELNNRPTWVGIPLRGILDVLESGKPRE